MANILRGMMKGTFFVGEGGGKECLDILHLV